MMQSLIFLTFINIIKMAEPAVDSSPLHNFPAESETGRKILSQSRSLEDGFQYDSTWLSDHSLQFQGCHSIIQYGEEGAQRADGEGSLSLQNLVKFRVCPNDSCNKGCKGLYLTDLDRFVESYMEVNEENAQIACETSRESCYCNDDGIDDEVCQNQCFIDSGLDYCIETDDVEEDFEIESFFRCELLENYYDDADTTYYVGPKCSKNGKAIYLDVYEDSGCIQPAPSGTYESITYNGNSLPYAKTSIINTDCISCKQNNGQDDDNANDDEVQLNEFCEDVYESAAKCERGIDIEYPQTSDCQFILSEIRTHDIHYKHPRTAIIFVWVLLCTTLALGHKVMTLQNEMERSNVKLSDHDGGMIDSGMIA